MSDFATNIPQVTSAQAAHEVTVNQLVGALSPSSVFGRNGDTSSALTWGYLGGRFNGTSVDNGTVALTASNTNYVVAHRTTLVVTVSTSNTNWNNTTTYGRTYKVTAGAATVTDWEDHRASNDGTGILSATAAALGGLGAVTGTGFVHITSGTEDGAATAVDLSSAHATGILAAARFPALTGDGTTVAAALAFTLATVNSNVGTFGSATKASVVTVNAKGLATAVSETTVTPAVGSITGLGTGVGTWLATPTGANLTSALSSGGGTTNFLRADGSFSAPPGSGGTTLTLTETPSDQSYTGTIVSLTYGESLTPGAPVYFASDGTVKKADANGASTYPVIGLAMETASSGSHVVLLMGIYRDDALFAWTVGGLIYLSTTAGTLTQTAPSTTDDVVQIVGLATHADRMLVNPQLNYATHT